MWFLTLETLGCVELFVTLGLRPRKANASAKHVKALHVDLETRRYAPEHEVLGNTQNTQKGCYAQDCQCEGLHVV